jgi:hypothetical protein
MKADHWADPKVSGWVASTVGALEYPMAAATAALTAERLAHLLAVSMVDQMAAGSAGRTADHSAGRWVVNSADAMVAQMAGTSERRRADPSAVSMVDQTAAGWADRTAEHSADARAARWAVNSAVAMVAQMAGTSERRRAAPSAVWKVDSTAAGSVEQTAAHSAVATAARWAVTLAVPMVARTVGKLDHWRAELKAVGMAGLTAVD